MKNNKALLEQRILKLEEEFSDELDMIDNTDIDNSLHSELISDLSKFISQCNNKFNKSFTSNTDKNKMLKKTKSFKLIKYLKEVLSDAVKK